MFPAGIIQEPFYSLDYPTAMNLGGLGSVIGHELGHAFDDSGSQYAGDGTLRNWWSTTSRTRFETSAQCIADLYSGYEVTPGANLDGELVLGESIADLGGMHQSYNTYVHWRSDSAAQAAEESAAIAEAFNMSDAQLFMVAFAQTWCSVATPEYEAELAANNPHPASRFRVLGTLSNSDAFASAFECPLGSTYNPESKCAVW